MAVEFLDEAPSAGVEYLDQTPDTPPTTDIQNQFEQFKAQKLAEANQGAGSRLTGFITSPARQLKDAILGTAGLVNRGAVGLGDLLGNAAGQEGLKNQAKTLDRNLAQTILESLARPVSDIGTLANQGYEQVKNNPLQSAIQAAIPISGLSELIPKNYTDDQLQSLFEQQLAQPLNELAAKQPVVPNIIGEANIPFAEALPLATMVPGAVGLAGKGINAAKAASSAKVIPRVTNKLADVGKFTSEKPLVQQRLLNHEYANALQDVAPNIKPKSGAKGFFEATDKTLSQSAETFRPLIENASPFTFTAENILPQVELKLSRDVTTQAGRQNVLPKIQHYLDELNSKTALNTTRELGADITRYYSSAAPEASADLIFAKKALRDALSDNIKLTLDQAGADPAIYSKYGLLDELKDIVGDNFRKESVSHSATLGKGLPTRIKEGLNAPMTSPRGVVVATGKALEPFTGGEPARINRQINSIFKDIKPSQLMTSEERQSLISSAKERRANLDKVSEFNKALQDAESERIASAASTDEVQEFLSRQYKEDVSKKFAIDLQKDLQKTYPKAISEELKSIRSAESPTLLEDYYYSLNNYKPGLEQSISRMETELRRRLGFKKYSKNFPEIRDALKIPKPRSSSNQPSKREVTLEEMIRQSKSSSQ